VVVYPKELTGLAQALTSRNVSVQDDLENHSELYSAIISESDQFENPPVFMREDCDQLTSHPVWALKIGEWMMTAARVATGSRPRVLEDEPDVMNSDDEDSKMEEHGDKLTGMYAQGCSSLEQARISEQQAQMQRAMATQNFSGSLVLSSSEPVPPRLLSPTGEDWSWMNENERKLAEAAVKKMAPPRPATRIPDSEPEIQAPAKAAPLVITKATLAPATDVPESFTKAVAPQQGPAGRPKGAKAPTRKKGQESPETKVSKPTADHHPMATRTSTKTGSGAGFRGVDGSRQTGYVCGKLSPSSKPGS
jgi:hypothetical protein